MHYLSLHVFAEFNCDDGWDLFGKFCYKFVTTAKSKTDAEEDCIVKGAHLASIHSNNEKNFLVQLTHRKNVWVGGERKGASFQWLDGTEFDYENWDRGQPDNYDPWGNIPNCISLPQEIYGKPGKWHDAHCGHSLTYVCKNLC